MSAACTMRTKQHDVSTSWSSSGSSGGGAPVRGLLAQPIIGYFSDRTWNRLRRRRPYFLGGAILASLALIVMPNSPALWVAAGMPWIMDASIDISMEPFRAFVRDDLPSAQRTTGLAMQSFFIGTGAAVVAFMIPVLARRTSRKVAHSICLVCGALGLLSIFFIMDPMLLLGSMVGVGIAWASVLSMPYAILTGALSPSKVGYYMGVFNFFIVIPQIVAAAIRGFLEGRFFGGEAIYALLIGGVSLVLAALLTLRVEGRDDVGAAVAICMERRSTFS